MDGRRIIHLINIMNKKNIFFTIFLVVVIAVAAYFVNESQKASVVPDPVAVAPVEKKEVKTEEQIKEELIEEIDVAVTLEQELDSLATEESLIDGELDSLEALSF